MDKFWLAHGQALNEPYLVSYDVLNRFVEDDKIVHQNMYLMLVNRPSEIKGNDLEKCFHGFTGQGAFFLNTTRKILREKYWLSCQKRTAPQLFR